MNNNESTDINTLLEISGYPNPGDIPILNRKIFKGQRVSVREHPYVVSIRRQYAHYLVGSLMSKNLVITVAHPLVDVPTFELGVVVGESYCDRGKLVSTVLLVIIHHLFDRYTLAEDIALVRFYEEINYRFSVKSIPLISPDINIDGGVAFVTGWGRCDNTGSELCLFRSSKFNPDEKMDPMLRSASFTMSTSNYYCEGYKRHEVPISSRMLCTGPAREEDPACPCMGVPGAPLVIQARLAGVLSWGFGCGYGHDLPLIYTSIRGQARWILENVVKLKKIKQSNLTQLFQITKAYLITEWFRQTRVIKPTLKIRRDKSMEPLDIDKALSDLQGTVYDVRDFINGGMLTQEKQNIYAALAYEKRNLLKLKLVSDEQKKIQSRPFVSNISYSLKDVWLPKKNVPKMKVMLEDLNDSSD